jgi:hypothetical protein
MQIASYGVTTLRARAFAAGLDPSPVAASPTYVVFQRTGPPTLSPAPPAGSDEPYVAAESVAVTVHVGKGVSAYCTLDGSVPVPGVSPACGAAPLLISARGTTTVRAVAAQANLADSLVASATYLILMQVRLGFAAASPPPLHIAATHIITPTLPPGADSASPTRPRLRRLRRP